VAADPIAASASSAGTLRRSDVERPDRRLARTLARAGLARRPNTGRAPLLLEVPEVAALRGTAPLAE
jgi:hypothetical protein